MLLRSSQSGSAERPTIYLSEPFKDPRWMLLRHIPAENRLVGYYGGAAGGGISTVRPFDLRNSSMTDDNVQSFATWAFANAFNMPIRAPNHSARQTSANVVASWENFLESGNIPAVTVRKSSESVSDIRNMITMEMSQIGPLTTIGALKNTDEAGLFGVTRKLQVRTGSPISGFQAMDIMRMMRAGCSDVPQVTLVNPENAKEALSAVSRPSSHAVHWYGSVKDEAARDRLQAAKSYPVLAGMIADNPFIARAVDAREPLLPPIMVRSGLNKGGLKRIAALRRSLPSGSIFEDGRAIGEDALGVNRDRRFRINGDVSLDAALLVLAELPPDRVPQDDDSWAIFHDILSAVAIPLENATGILALQTLSACKGDWKAFHATLARAADFEPEAFDRRTMALCLSDTLEAMDDFSCTVIMPQILRSIISTGQPMPDVNADAIDRSCRMGQKMILGQSKNVLANIFEISRRYAGRVPSINDILAVEQPEAALEAYPLNHYPPLIEHPFLASNGTMLWSLSNWDALKVESSRMTNCVGRAYLNSAFSLSSLILSARDQNGENSRCTIELRLRFDAGSHDDIAASIYEVQVRGHRNGPAPPDCVVAVQELITAIRSGALRIDVEHMLRWKQAIAHRASRRIGEDVSRRAPAKVTWASTLGVKPNDTVRGAALLGEWGQVCGGEIARANNAEFIYRHKDARDLLISLDPRAGAILLEREAEAAAERAKAREREAQADHDPAGP